ncbi:MAG: AAA family ATPase [Bacteroidetes bacterium 4572_117]|nr:MAG: AAA family ATPase [Bacteroidetes bacterium 4572_117]
MAFKRTAEQHLKKWKSSTHRKPLIIRGARQVGKTTLVKEFARSYQYRILLNLEKPKDLAYFEKYDNVPMIIEALLLANKIQSTDKNKCLLFIDEIQESPKAIELLRYFYEEFPELHVIAAGSLLEFAMQHIKSFPVGRVSYLYLHPLNFIEYLAAIKHETAIEQLNKIPLESFAHDVLLDLFNRYAIIGGMPEVINVFLENESMADLPNVYESIWGTYQNDVEKYASSETGRKVIKHIMSTAHLYLDQRIKFQHFGQSNYKSREVGEAMRNLDDARIIRLIYPSTDVEVPIKPDLKKSPRLQFLDTGLVNHVLSIQADLLGLKDLSSSYKGALIPHLITQELISLNTISSTKPNFWVREKKQASSEVDLVLNSKGIVIPIEIKSGSTGTLKSLHQFIENSNHPYAVRMYAGEFSVEKNKTPKGTPYLLMNLPYYLGTKLPEYIVHFVDNYHL